MAKEDYYEKAKETRNQLLIQSGQDPIPKEQKFTREKTALSSYDSLLLSYERFINSKYRILGVGDYASDKTSDMKFIDETITFNMDTLKGYFQYLHVSSSLADAERRGSNQTGFIPFNLKLDMDGLSGIKIYQKVNADISHLPSNYPESLDFIVTKVNHKLAKGDWETSIDTMAIAISAPVEAIPINVGSRAKKRSISAIPNNFDPISKQQLIPIDGEDPAPFINPNKIGKSGPKASNNPVVNDLTNKSIANFKHYKTYQTFNEKVIRPGYVVPIGRSDGKYFANPSKSLQSIGILKNTFYLHPSAARAFKKWESEMRSKNIPFLISAATRIGANTGAGPHGWGLAIDFSNLYQLVKGKVNPTINKNARISKDIYKQIAEIGAKYGWYNPWRLSDSAGTMDEIWHFEYWGPV